MSETVKFKQGEYLFREGDPPGWLYVIKEGCVSVQKRRPHGDLEIAKIYSNEVLGELAFFDRQARSASAIAVTDVEALKIDFEALDKIYGGTPPYIKTIVIAVVDRLRKANDTIRRLQKEAIAGQDGTPDKSGSMVPPADS